MGEHAFMEHFRMSEIDWKLGIESRTNKDIVRMSRKGLESNIENSRIAKLKQDIGLQKFQEIFNSTESSAPNNVNPPIKHHTKIFESQNSEDFKSRRE